MSITEVYKDKISGTLNCYDRVTQLSQLRKVK